MASVDAMAIIILMTFVWMAAFGIYAARYKKVPPNKALVVFGKKQRGTRVGFQVITGGGKFIVPILESYAFLPLELRSLRMNLKNVKIHGPLKPSRINVKGLAQVKISSNPRILLSAAEFLLNKSDSEINEIAQKTIEAYLRATLSSVSLDDIEQERDSIASKVQTFAEQDLNSMGLEIRSMIIEDVEALEGVEGTSAIAVSKDRIKYDEKILERHVKEILEKLLREKRIDLSK